MYLSGHFLTPRFRNFSKLPSGEVKWQYPPYTQKNCLTYIKIPSKIVWTCLSESVQTFFPCSIILCFYIKIKYYNFFLFVCRVQVSHQLIWYVLSVVPFLNPAQLVYTFWSGQFVSGKGKKSIRYQFGLLGYCPYFLRFLNPRLLPPIFSKLQHRKESSFQKFPSSGWTFYLPRQKIHFLHLRFFHEWN